MNIKRTRLDPGKQVQGQQEPVPELRNMFRNVSSYLYYSDIIKRIVIYLLLFSYKVSIEKRILDIVIIISKFQKRYSKSRRLFQYLLVIEHCIMYR